MFILKFFQVLILSTTFAGAQISGVGDAKAQDIKPEVNIISGLPADGILEFSRAFKFNLELKASESVMIRVLMKDNSGTIFFDSLSDTGPMLISPRPNSSNTNFEAVLELKSKNFKLFKKNFTKTEGLLMNLVVEVKSPDGKMLFEKKHKVLMKAKNVNVAGADLPFEGDFLKIDEYHQKQPRVEVVVGGNDEVWHGQIDREATRKVIRSQLNFFRSCYERPLKKNQVSPGIIYLSWEIHRSGKVKKSAVLKDNTTLDNPQVKECVRSRLEVIRFPEPVDEIAEVLNFPIEFK